MPDWRHGIAIDGVEHYSDDLGNTAEIHAHRGASREQSFLEVTILLAED